MTTKRYFIIALIIALMLFCLFNQKVIARGIEEFQTADCRIGTTGYLLPSDEFLQKYPYRSGNYFFVDNGLMDSRIIVIMYLKYSPSIYVQAKQHCIEAFVLGETKSDSYQGYTFIENITRISKEDSQSVQHYETTDFPHLFNLFAHNDTEYSLLFTGYWSCGDNYQTERDLAVSDFEVFMDNVYSRCFSESSGNTE